MPVNTKHSEYIKNSETWERTRDGIAGQETIKKKEFVYLPQLNGQLYEDYKAYLARAQYVNFASRILNMALGQLFKQDPVIKGIDDDFMQNIDLTGKSFIYFSRDIAAEIMQVNRCGILVDYSEDQKRPYLTLYKTESIINWKCDRINGIEKLTMIMLEGIIEEYTETDPYKSKITKIYKELYIDEIGFYAVRNWKQIAGQEKFEIESEIIPVMNGSRIDFIPFFLCTSNGISTEITKAPLVDLVNVNLAHYINSADYENMLHWTGARTVIVKGWDASKPFPIGGCAAGGDSFDAHFLEASSDSALEEGMKRKEEQMAILGGSIISGKGRYVASAQTALITSQGEYATLADISNAMDSCVTAIMDFFMEWAGGQDDVTIEYNTEFETQTVDPQTLLALSGLVSSKLMSFDTFFYNMKNKNMYEQEWTIEEEIKAIQNDMKAEMDKKDQQIQQLYQKANMQNQQGKQNQQTNLIDPKLADNMAIK
jgi:hypothetical protein